MKEISYIHAEDFPAAEIKHGPIALVDEETPSIVVAPRCAVYDKLMISLAEIKDPVQYSSKYSRHRPTTRRSSDPTLGLVRFIPRGGQVSSLPYLELVLNVARSGQMHRYEFVSMHSARRSHRPDGAVSPRKLLRSATPRKPAGEPAPGEGTGARSSRLPEWVFIRASSAADQLWDASKLEPVRPARGLRHPPSDRGLALQKTGEGQPAWQRSLLLGSHQCSSPLVEMYPLLWPSLSTMKKS